MYASRAGFLFRPLLSLLLLSFLATAVCGWAEPQRTVATYSHDSLNLAVSYHSEYEGAGRLTVEILDPEDHVLGRSERRVVAAKGDGVWRQAIAPDTAMALDELIWQRVRYKFEYDGDRAAAISGVEAISRILRQPVVRVLGQTEYVAGSEAAIRVIVWDADRNGSEASTAPSGEVRIELLVADKPPLALFHGRLNKRGTVDAHFRFPAGLTGTQSLRYAAETEAGAAEYTQSIALEEKAAILLTSEKPIYQPGQTIHVRALALDRADHKASRARPLTFEVEDPRGNKVFKKVTRTDEFGVASAEFALADEVNLGTYHLRALMGDAASPSNTAEIALNVERYVLPKFKVAIEFASKDGKPKKDYRPGDHVTGTVRANYFFGKPVDQAAIEIKASSMDVAVFEAASAKGKTDSDGVFHFDLLLPAYFAGRPLSRGAARALVEATVKDSAAHSETRGEPITISASPLLITAVPEGGKLVPHLENEVFLLSSYPDGTPASATLTVHPAHGREQRVTTDSGGVGVIRFLANGDAESLQIEADDHHGNRTSATVPLETRGGGDQILLRSSRAIFKAGDRIDLTVLSTRSQGAVYVDLVKNGQTLLTRDLDLKNGMAELTLTATPEMAGTLDIDAYLFGRDAQPVADHRLVFVQPADELKIETTADAAEYKPGSDARIRFHVTNARGEGVSAALGVQVVDEAVFALAEKEPGFAKVFFYLEQEVMKPRYEIHSLSMPGVVESGGSSSRQTQELAARALFSATEMAEPARLDTEFGRSLPQERFGEYQQRYRAVLVDQLQKVAAEMGRKRQRSADFVDLFAGYAHPRDAWGTPLRLTLAQWTWPRGPEHERYYLVRSAGPDREFDTADDLTVYLSVAQQRTGPAARVPGNAVPIAVTLEHDRGAFNGRAEATGSVVDASGAVIPGATITLRSVPSQNGMLQEKETLTARADAMGQFSIAGLPAGRYHAAISARGFRNAASEFTVQARDRAVLSAVLAVDSVNQTVMVEAGGETPMVILDAAVTAPTPRGRAFGMGMGMGMANGAAGGVAAERFLAQRAEVRSDGANLIDPNSALRKVPMEFRTVTGREGASPAEPHVRSYFPEALYINPEILTDGKGDASVSVPIADSITTWRMAMIASTQAGALGTGASSLKVFQDFFVDLDLPVTLTQGDRVTLPIAAYNYAGKPGKVSLRLEPEAWYSLENDTPEKSVTVESGRVGASQFTLNANRIGKFKLTLRAHMDGAEGGGDAGRDDIVIREIEVVPNGQEQNLVFNGRLEGSAGHDLQFPANAIPDATSVLVRLYPGPLSQVIEGMDSILRMPGGCFEQTSSSTYPNVLALDYMKRTKKLTPEVHAKAEGYIANGYQRLLTFEVPGGGFSWFGQAPANKILTAYGLMEFNDMAKVSDVDQPLIERTREWLISQQQPDGSWKPDTSFINEGATNRYNSNVLRITAYVAWALADTGYEGPAVAKAKRYIETHDGEKPDTYTLAVIANFAAENLKKNAKGEAIDPEFTRRAMQALLDARTDKNEMVWWEAEETGVYSTGTSAAIETTGLATQALLKWGQASEQARKALSFIASKKQAAGNWGTTQATIMALRALLLASQLSATDVRGTVHVTLNGKQVEALEATAENNDLLHQFVLKGIDPRTAAVGLSFEGTGGLAYQVVGRYFTPWETKPVKEAMAIDIAYDRTKLAQNDIATATATVRNDLDKTANMVMVDLGIPPGFELLSEDLQAFQEKTASDRAGRLEKFSQTATQAILYFNALAPGQTVTLKFRLRAKYPIRAQSFQSRVYEYYDPEVQAIARPAKLEVTAR